MRRATKPPTATNTAALTAAGMWVAADASILAKNSSLTFTCRFVEVAAHNKLVAGHSAELGNRNAQHAGSTRRVSFVCAAVQTYTFRVCRYVSTRETWSSSLAMRLFVKVYQIHSPHVQRPQAPAGLPLARIRV